MTTNAHDLIVVGAGFAGLYSVIHARRRGLDVVGLDMAQDVGGTWYWNRYPGARCDVESIDYSYSFDEDLQREWRWSERYATQPEILRYLSHVADRFDVRPHFRFEERVTQAEWDESQQLWTVRCASGRVERARWVIMATGALSKPLLPDIPGRDSFQGEVYQTSAWPLSEVDFTGKRVAVIGTGSSGVQIIPRIASAAADVVVYQRTPNYSVPAFNRPLNDAEWAQQQEDLAQRRHLSWSGAAGSPWTSHPVPFYDVPEKDREEIFEEAWTRGGVLFAKAFQDLTSDPVINDAARVFFETKLAEKAKDPAVRAMLTPTDHYVGTKRICTDTNYYESFNMPSVSLVDLRHDPFVEVTAGGIQTEGGFHAHDVIVYATGFDALTGALTTIDIRGRDGRSLRDEWADGPQTLYGIAVPGFPNLLPLNGPGTPCVLANMALTSEQQGEYALRLIDFCDAHGYTSAEAREDAARTWTSDSAALAGKTLFGAARSWYTGANIDGKARGFLPYIGGFNTYIDHVDKAAADGYAGFALSSL